MDLFNYYRELTSDKPYINSGIDKNHRKTDCISVSILDGVRHSLLYSLALDKPRGHEKYTVPKVRHFGKTNKFVLSPITFYLADDDQKPVDFNRETKSCTCLITLIK